MVRSLIDQAVTLLGVVVIVVPVALLSESWVPLLIVLAGTLMVGAGTWRLGTRLLADRRVHIGLRSEVDEFIRLVRRLNAHALAGEIEEVDALRGQMKESVDRMAGLAGESSLN